MTIGACATSGGVQALRNGSDIDEIVRTVYATPAYIATLADSTPIADHVKVDLELTGCPVDRGQLLGALASLLQGSVPRPPTTPVCIECKRRGYVCVVVAKGEPCLGPVTRTGCGALCPGDGPRLLRVLRAVAAAEHRRAGGGCSSISACRRRTGRGLVPVHHRLRARRSAMAADRIDEASEGGRAMTHRSVEVPVVARVEGEGALHLRIEDDVLTTVELEIYEPPRFFEAFLRGRHAMEVSDIVPRICGICPVAYQMSAIHGLERLFEVRGAARAPGSCAGSCTWASGSRATCSTSTCSRCPTTSGSTTRSSWRAADTADVVERGLRLKRLGNDLMAAIGGREIHPVSPAPGRVLEGGRRATLRAFLPRLEEAADGDPRRRRPGWRSIDIPVFERDAELVAMVDPARVRR